MFSGKTSHLINIYNKYKSINKILVLNHSLDIRYSNNEVVSHAGEKIPCTRIKELMSLVRYEKDCEINNYEIILINESQFFNDLTLFVQIMLERNKKIYLTGLDGDFQQKKFGYILDLIPLCDSVTKLKANCMNCKKENCAIFSIGSNEIYLATCRLCYNLLNK